MAVFSASKSISRRPRAVVKIGGGDLALSPLECTVHVSLHQSADTFYFKLPLDNPAGLDEGYWTDTAPIPITISACNDINEGGFTDLMIGQADTPQIDYGARMVLVRGRDLTAGMTDLASSKKWPNQSSQQIIQELAGDAGLTVQFGGDADKAGLQFDQDYTEFSDSDTAWNVVVDAARRLGCIAFIKGKTLYVQPIDHPPQDVFEVAYQRSTPDEIASGTFVSLYTARNLQLAKDVTISVKSWQHKQGKTITSKYRSKGKSSASDKALYERRAANLTKDQQDRIARNHLRETLTHERGIFIDNLPGDVGVIPPIGLRLSGTGTGADQDYVLSEAVHSFTLKGGYLMNIQGHNQDAGRGEPTQEQ